MIAMAARTIRSLSCSPSVPTAIREFAIEVGNSVALTVIIFSWLGCGKRKHNSATKQEKALWPWKMSCLLGVHTISAFLVVIVIAKII